MTDVRRASVTAPRLRSFLSAMIATVLVASMAVFAPTAAFAAPPTTSTGGEFTGITVDVSGGSVLASGSGTVSIDASNATTGNLYNASAVAVLPLGVTYVAGSSRPGAPNAVGEPEIRTWVPDPELPEQTVQVLVWSNVADLPRGAELDLSFDIVADDALHPVGSTFTVDAGVYANGNERIVPKVTIPTDGRAPIVTDASAGGDDATDVTIAALRLSKVNSDAEAEVYRGPDNATRYSLTVVTAAEAGSDDVIVVDRVPADYQVTACDLGDARFSCDIEIVTDDGQVFTQLTWNLGAVGAGQSITLTYEAFVGLQRITAPDGIPNGAPTRPGETGNGVDNTATATGTYTGAVAPDATTSVSVTARAGVRVLDLGVVKTASRGDFFAGEIVDFTLHVRTSQYVTSDEIVLTDVIPDGLCPVVPAGVPTSGTWPADCPAPGGGTVTGGTMTAATANGDGTFTVTFTVDASALAEDEDADITYGVYMRGEYRDGSRTSSGDVSNNVVEIAGDVSPAATNTVDAGTVASTNGSSASLATGSLSMTKTVWTNPDRRPIVAAGPLDGTDVTCNSAPAGEYVDANGPRLQLGDLACFRISVDFTDGSSTRDAILTDFLPAGTELVEWGDGPSNDVLIVESPDGDAQWLLGTLNANGSRYVAPGATLEMDLLVRVTEVPAADEAIDITGNLAKLRYTSGDGRVMAARDDVDLTLAPVTPLELAKTVDGSSSIVVQEQQEVTYAVTVTHAGDAASGNDYPLETVDVADALPAGFVCDDISSTIAAPLSCDDDGPVDGRSQLSWALSGSALGADGRFTPGETLTLTYTLVIPAPLSISTAHENTAAVTRYTAATTDGTSGGSDQVVFYPAERLGAFPAETANAPTASDSATIELGDASVAKAVTRTGITAAGNDALSQATIGEEVDYVYSVTIPARTSVFGGVLDDGLPLGGRLQTIAGPAGLPTVSGVPASDVAEGCTADAAEFRICADGTLLFPTTWTNTADAPVTISVTLPTRVADVAANVNGADIPNTALFRSSDTAGGSLVSRDTATAGVLVAEPGISVAKTSSSSVVSGTQVISYTLTAQNAAGRAPLYEPAIVDCLPNALQVNTLPAGTPAPVPGDGTNGCPTGYSVLDFALTSPMLGGTQQSVTYSVTVPSAAPAGQAYTNTATLRGSSLPGTSAFERSYTSTADRTVTVNRPTVVKTSSQGVTVPGQDVTWTVTATIPANTEYFDATFIDALPAALGPAADGRWTVTCGGGDATWRADCLPAQFLPAAGGSPNTFGVFLGNIAPSATSRTVVLTLTTLLPAGTSVNDNGRLTNTGALRWNRTDKADPTTTGASWDDDQSAVASTTVRHPLVGVTKSVSDTTPAQGEVFTYSVTATASAARTVPAFNVSIVDSVPNGIVVLGADNSPLANGESTASGGVWNQTARTLTWTVPRLDVGAAASVTRTYPARLAPASALSGAALTNSVAPAAWTSLATAGRTYGPGTAATAAVTPQFPKIDAGKTQVTPSNPVYIGEPVTFRVTMTNVGGATAASLDAVDTLPTGWSYVPGSATVTVRTGAPVATAPTITGDVLRWSDVGGASVNLQPNEVIVITYQAVAADDVRIGLDYAHRNSVTAANVEDATGGTTYGSVTDGYIGRTAAVDARIAAADLSITKVANDDFVAGATGTYTLTVRNNGPDPAAGVQVVDQADLPAGVTLLGATGAGWACDAPVDGALSCVRSVTTQTLAAGATWTLTVSAAIAADVADGTEIPNTATVTSDTEDRTQANNEDADTAVVRGSADLSIVKRSSDEAIAGGDIDWSITVTNLGPSVSRGSDAAPIVITDELPDTVSGVEVVSATDGVDCAVAGGTLTCEIPFTLAVGGSVAVSLSGTVDSDVAPGAEIANTAVVTPVTTDPVSTNNSSTSETPIDVEEALTIEKSVIAPADGDVVPGETITYRMVVSNAGPSDARGVSVLDALPAGLTFDSIVAGGDDWTATTEGSGVRFSLDGTVPAAGSAQFDILVAVGPGVEGDVTNTAVVSSTWRADQDTSSATLGSDAIADLAIAKSIDVTQIVAGAADVATYTLSVDNLGPSDAAGPVVVTDLLPAGVRVADDVPDECDVTEVSGRQQVRCVDADGIDVADAAWVIEIPVLVDAAVTVGTLTNTATVAGPTADSDPTNNTGSTPVTVLQRASLDVSKQAADAAVAGGDVTWTVTVTNNGPSDAQTVSLTDVLDPRLTLVSASSTTDGVSCSGAQTLVCSLGVVPVGESVEITVVTTVSSTVVDGAVIPNSATATSTTLDAATGLPATDDGDDSVTIGAESTLTLTKDPGSAQVDAGDVATYDIVVGNDGPSDAAAPVTVVDTLPAGQTFLAATSAAGPAEWDCSVSGQTVTCVLETDDAPVSLTAGASAPTLQIAATVSASLAPTTLTNVASASSPTSATSPSDDAEIDVVTRADLELTKSHLPQADAVAGLDFTWNLRVENHGPSDSVATADDPIVVTDTLPAGVTLASSPTSGGADTVCSVTGDDDGEQIVECARTTTLPAGESVEIDLHVMLDQSLSGDLTNTASVAPGLTPQPDTQVYPDTDSDTVAITEVADLALAKDLTTATLVAGREATWTISVQNLGPSDSDATADDPISVVDTLPEGVVGATASGDGWVCEPIDPAADGRDRIECLRATTLPVGAAPVITVTGTVASDVRGSLTNEALVAPGLTAQPVDDAGDDEDSATGVVTESADVSITKAIIDTVVAGATGTYRFQIVNLGPSDARDIVVRDALPAGLSFAGIADTTENDGWTCTPDATDPRDVACVLDEPLPAGATTVLDIVVNAEQQLQGDLTNVVTVESSTPDPDLANNESRVVGLLAERTDLAIVKAAVGDPIVGGQISFTLTATNKGPSTARGVVITDAVPAQLRVDAVTVDGMLCTSAPIEEEPTVVTCVLDELAAGASAPIVTITATVLPDAYPAISNTATIAAATPEDPATTADNSSTVTLTVPPQSELVITKELTRGLEAGFGGEYTITVTNQGPTADPGPITVTDRMPAGLSFVSATVDGTAVECVVDGADVRCDVGPLDVGQTATLVLQVHVADSVTGTVVNTATVLSAADPDADAMVAEASGEVDRTRLALTGAAPWGILALALMLLLAGGLLVLRARRRTA
ncbi:hypothetical protein AB3M89_04760 [Microbacterium sp. 179-I 3D2 NHS]|uniref:hypothetical protein n=1 Tax=Microbacterium sp. 179-I 3D2 NHS TaxID=3235178 RepID=UPI0039A365B2